MTPEQLEYWIKRLSDPAHKGKRAPAVIKDILRSDEYAHLTVAGQVTLLTLIVGFLRS